MPWRELPHRLREQLRRRVDPGRALPKAPAGPLPRWPVELRLDAVDRAEIAALEDQLLRGGYLHMGQVWPPARSLGGAGDLGEEEGFEGWAFALDLRGGADPRPWMEGHRLQALQGLGLGGAEARSAGREVLERWIRRAPPLWGLGWASGLEVACRVVSLLRWADGWRGASAQEIQRFRDLLWAHGWYLERYPSLYSSANNHRIAEASALVLLGRALGETDERRWASQGMEALSKAVPGVITEDGGSAEMAVGYLAFSLEWLLIAQITGPLPAPVEARMVRAAELLSALLDKDGELPAIGDWDGGVALRQGYPERGYGRSVVGAAAARWGRTALRPAGWAPDLRARLLGVRAPREAGGSRGRRRGKSFPLGGLTVLRSEGLGVVVDHGPLGWPALAAHGHADALAVYVEAEGAPLLVGQGTGWYRGAPAWRRWFRGTGAHNTVWVDGLDQSEPHEDPFLWRRRARVTLRSVGIEPEGGWVEASHDGYARIGVLHRREVRLEGGRLEVRDTLEGEGKRRIQLPFHLAQGLMARPEGEGRWSIWRGERRLGTLSASLKGSIICQERDFVPGPGVLAPGYGHLVGSCALWLEGEVRLPWRHGWVFDYAPVRQV